MPETPLGASEMHRVPATAEPVESVDDVEAIVDLAEAQRRAVEALQEVRIAHERIQTEHSALRQVIAHELSNPLTAVVGALDLLCQRDLSPNQAADLLTRARRQAHQLFELVDDLLSLPVSPSLEAARAELEEVRVSELLADVVAAVAHRLEPERLQIDVPDGLVVISSAPRLRRVLVNLIANAARYSPPATPVALTVTRHDGLACFEVIDAGPGVDPQIATEMFAPFVSGADPDTEGAGLGLGLWVVRSLVISLGGTVQLVPNQPTGTRAIIALPQHRRADNLPAASPEGMIDLTAEDLRAIRSISSPVQ